MKPIFVFLGGSFVTLIVLGVIAGIFFFKGGSNEKKAALEFTAPALGLNEIVANRRLNLTPLSGPEAGKSKPILSGTITLPPMLKKIIESKQHTSLAIYGRSEGVNLFVNPVEFIENPKFPYRFQIEINPGVLSDIWAKKYTQISLTAKVVYDFEGDHKSLTIRIPKHMISTFSMFVEKPKIEKFESGKIEIPLLVINKSIVNDPQKDCTQLSPTSLSGILKPGPKMLRQPDYPKKYVLIATPKSVYWTVGHKWIDLGLRDLSPHPLVDLGSKESSPFIMQFLEIHGPAGAPFNLKLPAVQEAFYVLSAVACNANEDELSCKRRALPVYRDAGPYSISIPQEKFTAVGKDFALGVCGMKDHVFYLYHVDSSLPPATEASIQASDPPELIDGAIY